MHTTISFAPDPPRPCALLLSHSSTPPAPPEPPSRRPVRAWQPAFFYQAQFFSCLAASHSYPLSHSSVRSPDPRILTSLANTPPRPCAHSPAPRPRPSPALPLHCLALGQCRAASPLPLDQSITHSQRCSLPPCLFTCHLHHCSRPKATCRCGLVMQQRQECQERERPGVDEDAYIEAAMELVLQHNACVLKPLRKMPSAELPACHCRRALPHSQKAPRLVLRITKPSPAMW